MSKCRQAACTAVTVLAVLTLAASTAWAQNAARGRAISNGGPVEVEDRRPARDQQPPPHAEGPRHAPALVDVESMLSPDGLTGTLKFMLIVTVLSLAPSILVMTTCFVRFVIVLSLLRHALGTQQLPSNQIVVSLSLFLTFLVMAPVWQRAYDQGIRPYANARPIPGLRPGERRFDGAFRNTARPLRQFMGEQIERTGNSDAVWMLWEFHQPEAASRHEGGLAPQSYEELPLSVLLPSYVLSELKTAFVIGFQVFLPFLVIDMVVSAVLVSMGMLMLPPVIVSLPFKLLLFVLIDGWFLTVGMLLESVRPFG